MNPVLQKEKDTNSSLIILNEKHMLYMVRLHKEYTNKKDEVLGDFIVIDDEYITINQNDLIQFFTEIRMFDKGDINNRFFEIVEKNNAISLKLKNIKHKIFLEKFEVFSINKIYDIVNKSVDDAYPLVSNFKISDDEWQGMYFLLHKLKKAKGFNESDEYFRQKILKYYDNGIDFKPKSQ